MATAIDISATGIASGTPLTAAPITISGEEEITFTNIPVGTGTFSIVLSSSDSGLTYGLATTETGGQILPGVANLIEATGGRSLFVAGAGDLYIRIF